MEFGFRSGIIYCTDVVRHGFIIGGVAPISKNNKRYQDFRDIALCEWYQVR